MLTSDNGSEFGNIFNILVVVIQSLTSPSVMNKTLSRLTLAKTIMSLNSNVQYGFTDLPSTRDRSPPNKFNLNYIFNSSNSHRKCVVKFEIKRTVGRLHYLDHFAEHLVFLQENKFYFRQVEFFI